MLVITRREGEEIVIGDPAKPFAIIKITSVVRDRVRVAMDFPRGLPVHRKEVADEIVLKGGKPA